MLALLSLASAADVREPLTALVSPLLEEDRIGVLVVAVIADGEVRTLTFGARSEGVDKNTGFEIGSVSKAFTGLLLAEAVRRGEVALTDPVSKHVSSPIPTWEGTEITLLDLATHTSGLPRLPADFAPTDPRDPYAHLTWTQVEQSLAKTVLDAKPGESYLYSNLGAALLGHALEQAGGKPYAELLAERVVDPLHLESTDVDGVAVLQGHDADGVAVPAWSLGPYAPAGGIHSTARDLTRVAAALLKPEGDIGTSIALATQSHRSLGDQGSLGLFWHRTPEGAVWHNGQTGGFHALVAAAPARNIAVVALGDTATDFVDRVGFAALELAAGQSPARLPVRRTREVSATDAKPLAGRYGPAEVVFEADALWLALPDQPRRRLWPAADCADCWFLRDVPAQLTFDGNRLVLEQEGARRQEWRRRN
ncbi:MAG: serine hydrolase domain-containing protein [Myxococcota bacterium]